MRFKRALLLGLLSWLIPFATSFALFPLKKANPPLFTTLMYLIELSTAGLLLSSYFRGSRITPPEAALVGTLWLAMNLVFDYPMFAFGPMKMTAAGYYSEIGLVYLTFPLFGLLAGRLKPTERS
jgi:hypothetical protein